MFRTMTLGKERLGVPLRVGARARAGSWDRQFSPLGHGSLWRAVVWGWGGQVVLIGFCEAGVGEDQIKVGALGKVTRASGSSLGDLWVGLEQRQCLGVGRFGFSGL